MTGLGEHDGKVRRGRRLALAGERAGDGDDLQRRVEPQELHVRAQPAIDLDGELVRFAEGDRSVVRRRLGGDHGEHRRLRQLLEVLVGADRVVQVVDEERGAQPEEQPDGGRQAPPSAPASGQRDRSAARPTSRPMRRRSSARPRSAARRAAPCTSPAGRRASAACDCIGLVDLRLQLVDLVLQLRPGGVEVVDRLLAPGLGVGGDVRVGEQLGGPRVLAAHRHGDDVGRSDRRRRRRSAAAGRGRGRSGRARGPAGPRAPGSRSGSPDRGSAR